MSGKFLAPDRDIPSNRKVLIMHSLKYKLLPHFNLAVVLCLMLTVLQVNAQEPLEQVSLQLKWKHAFQFAGYYAALELGYYAQAGLDVTLLELSDDTSPPEILLNGTAQYAVTGSEIVIHRAQGKPLVALATIFQHSPYGFLVRADSGINRMEDFVGKRVMLNSGAQDADLQVALLRAGLSAADYTRMPTSFDALSLARFETDVFNAYVTDQLFTLREQGIDGRYILPQLYGVDFYTDILATTEDEIAGHPERVKAFRDASLKGWDYALNHIPEMIDLILLKFNTQQLSRAHLEYEANTSREMIQPLLVSIGYMNPARWESIRSIYVELGTLDTDSSITGLIYQEESTNSYSRWVLDHLLTIIITCTLFIVGLLLLALLHFRRTIIQRTDELALSQGILHDQNLKLQNLLDSINGISWEFNLKENKFIYVSPNIERILGYTSNEWDDMDAWLDTIHEEDRDTAFNACMHETEAGRDHVFEYRMRKKSGETIWVMDVVRVIKDSHGSPVELAGFIVNITERKLAEKALRRAQKMDAVGQLTGGIAHDFNNILGIIQGNLDLLENQVDNPDQTRKRVNSLKRVTERAIKLTQQLLGFSRTQADHTSIADLNSIIEGMSELNRRSVTPEIQISYELQKNLFPVRIDTSDFQDALLNLIINARDAIAQGGSIIVSTSNAQLEHPYDNRYGNIEAGEYVKLSVTDTGVGIPTESLEKIFEPFFTTKEYGKGTGLGLAMVFGFVQRSAALIDVESTEFKGSTFNIFFPHVAEGIVLTPRSPPSGKVSPGGNETILVVDDEEDLLALAKARLQENGYKVLLASDATQAMAILKANPDLDLMFTDVVMPGEMNGYDLAEAAYSIKPSLKIVHTSGFTAQNVSYSYQSRYATTLLNKPYTQQEMLDKLRAALDSRS